ncbi:hypothetical protein K1W54_04155 [Micromonospora sp. CPCC 205371]|nr:hypothetical protein [Micromonospora sp. CPCC 205371]
MGRTQVAAAATQMLERLQAYSGGEFLLAFPPAPFVLTLAGTRPGDIARFVSFAEQRPEHTVRIRRAESGSATAQGWFIEPADAVAGYRLTFSLPPDIEEWIIDERQGRTDTGIPERRMLSTIMIYRWEQGMAKVYQLRYTPAA